MCKYVSVFKYLTVLTKWLTIFAVYLNDMLQNDSV